MKYTDLGSSSLPDNGLNVVEHDVVPFIMYLAQTHEWSCDSRDLEDQTRVPVDARVAQTERLLTDVIDGLSVSH